jgi:hypothetical protein
MRIVGHHGDLFSVNMEDKKGKEWNILEFYGVYFLVVIVVIYEIKHFNWNIMGNVTGNQG